MGLLAWLNQAKRLEELEEVVAKLAHRWDEQELHYIELRARCKRLLDRTEKAAVRVVESESHEVESPNGGAANATIGATGRLSDHQRQIQQQILRRRAGM